MRYELDSNGYILSVFWGCNSGNCAEYEGIVPEGYDNLTDWSENAIINAYYINEEGNLTLDAERLMELEEQIEQDYIDNMPILYKDLYGTNNVLDDQYQKATAEGLVIEADNVKKINPMVWGSIEDYGLDDSFSIDIVTQGKQMLKNDAETEEIAGITFTKNRDGSILINGTSTAEIYYNLSGNGTNTTPIFALKNNLDYYLNLGGLSCSMRYYDGETTGIVYEGVDGVINLPENKMVTRVLLTIPTGTTIDNKTIYPMLNYGSEPYEYEEYKIKKLPIVFEGHDNNGIRSNWVGFFVEEGQIWVQIENPLLQTNDVYTKYLAKGNVNLFDGYNLVYIMQNGAIGMTYNTNNLALEGTTTENSGFRIDEEGNLYCNGATINNALINNAVIKSFGNVGDNAITISSGDTYENEITNTITDNSIRIWNMNEDYPGADVLPEIELYSAMGTVLITPFGIEVNGERIVPRSYIMVRPSADYTIQKTNTVEIVPLDYQMVKGGNKLTLNSDGTITIGAGVSRIKVSSSITLASLSATGTRHLYYYINETNKRYIQTYVNKDSQNIITIADYYIDVSEGDVFSLRRYGTVGEKVASTRSHLSIEVVE